MMCSRLKRKTKLSIQNFSYKDAAANSLFTQLFRWAESSDSRELRSYSMALLGAGMGAEQVHQYRQNNFTLIPIALQRLRDLYVKKLKKSKYFFYLRLK